MGARQYLVLLRRHWALIVTLCLAGMLVSAVYALRQTPEYTAASTVFVSTQTAATPNDLAAGTTFTQQVAKSYARVATTRYVLGSVAQGLDPQTTPAELASRVTVTTDPNSAILTIQVTDSLPARAAVTANRIAAALSTAVTDLNPQSTDLNSQVKLTTVEPAVANPTPIQPGLLSTVPLGLVGGLVVALGVIALRQQLDTRTRGVQEVEAVLRQPILGAVLYDAGSRRRPLVTDAEGGGLDAEAYRTLRASLQFLELGSRSRMFVLTSSIEGEGKTTVAVNLAEALARAGERVLIVDADLRRPRVAEYLGMESEPGLTDVLIGQASLAESCRRRGDDGPMVLPAGRTAPNPNELLQSGVMDELIRHLGEQYDVVLFDAPPLLPVSDAAILARRTSGAILIAASGRVRRAQLRRAETIVDQAGAGLLGAVVTMLPRSGFDAYRYAEYPRPTAEPARV